jgi:hypothetical protein
VVADNRSKGRAWVCLGGWNDSRYQLADIRELAVINPIINNPVSNYYPTC